MTDTSRERIKLGTFVASNPKHGRPMHGRLISYVEHWKQGHFVVVQDAAGNTQSCSLDELTEQ